jgi:hypothetical protein
MRPVAFTAIAAGYDVPPLITHWSPR